MFFQLDHVTYDGEGELLSLRQKISENVTHLHDTYSF